MIHLRFLNPDGTLAAETDIEPENGLRLLEVAQTLGLPLEGTCEGSMACSTCHVLVNAADLSRLPPPGPHEEDMLDFTAYVGPLSRLSCQIELTDEIGHLEVSLPPGHANMLGRQ